MIILIRIAAVAVLSLGTGAAVYARVSTDADPAKSYPNRPIRMIAQFQPGTTTDLIARGTASCAA